MNVTEHVKAAAESFGRNGVREAAAEGHPMLQWILREEDWTGNHLRWEIDKGPLFWILSRVSDYERVILPGQELAAWGVDYVRAKVREHARLLGGRLAKSLIAGGPAKDFHGESSPGVDSLCDWIPEKLEGVDYWKMNNRNRDRIRLAGTVLSVAGQPIEEALLDAEARAQLEGSPDALIWMHPDEHERLLANRPAGFDIRSFQDVKCIYFEAHGLHIHAARDPDCPKGNGFRIPRNAYSLASLGPAPQWLDWDGSRYLCRDEDALEVRLGFYGNTVLGIPGQCVRLVGLGQ